MEARLILSTARLIARSRAKYFSLPLLNLLPEEAPSLQTIGVSKRYVLYWDPVWMADQNPEEIATILIHEVMHLLRDHHERTQNLSGDCSLKNLAADLEINDDVFFSGMRWPDGRCALPKDYGFRSGLLLEEYYRLLQAEKIDKIETPSVGNGRCGSAAGNPLPCEPENQEGRTDVEMRRIKRSVAEEIQIGVARGFDRIPASWKRWANSVVAPAKIPWRSKLSRAIRGAVADQVGAVDHRYNLPSRKQAGIGYGSGVPILPCLRAPAPHVSVFVDTSGSMSKYQLEIALRETRGVLSATGTNVDFCACDSRVQTMHSVNDWRKLPQLLKGGGGTDFAPAFEQLMQRRVKPNVIVAITDGIGPAPLLPPKKCKTIWLLVGYGHQHPNFRGKEWGEFIEMDD